MMKTILFIIILLFSIVGIYFYTLGVKSKSQTAIGIIDGQLSKCPTTPNCICSEYKDHTSHYAAPISTNLDSFSEAETSSILIEIIREMGGTIQITSKQYIAVTFTSAFFGFVDDLEIRIDKDNKVIHLRSASRVGRSDLGINKKRIKLLKQRFKAALLD